MLRRLLPGQYQPGLENVVYAGIGGVKGIGSLEGDAQGGEPVARIYLDIP